MLELEKQKYFKGDASDQELGEALACVQKVLISFKDNIRGKDKNYYTGPELGKFLTKNLLKDKSQISDSFMVEFFKFKAILLGGSADKLTLSEVEGLSSLVAIIQPDTVI